MHEEQLEGWKPGRLGSLEGLKASAERLGGLKA
jgi:hypothetical protein